jgi:hypothetical protein
MVCIAIKTVVDRTCLHPLALLCDHPCDRKKFICSPSKLQNHPFFTGSAYLDGATKDFSTYTGHPCPSYRPEPDLSALDRINTVLL